MSAVGLVELPVPILSAIVQPVICCLVLLVSHILMPSPQTAQHSLYSFFGRVIWQITVLV